MATVYDHVTAAIIKQLDQGIVPWIRPWKEDAKAMSPWGLPFNVAKGREYRGANVPLLWGTAKAEGYQSDAWLTLKQANALGGSVLKGERASWVHYYLWKEDAKGKRFPILKAYRVFNVSQTTGCELPERTSFQQLGTGALEDRVKALGAKVRLGGNRAYFDVSNDRIALPLMDKFKSADNFYSTLAHELTHWTGHSSRLNRDMTGHFGTSPYAREELIAELGSAFVCARFQIPLEGLQHPQYLGSWLKVLKEDSRAIMRAASAAQRAADMIAGTSYDHDHPGEPKEEPEAVPLVVVPAMVEPVPVVEPVTVDADTCALAAQYIGEVARALYWAGHADALDREMAAKSEAIQSRKYDRVGRVTGEADGLPGKWVRHPVTGYRVRVPHGAKLLDLIPYGRDPVNLAKVRKHFDKHGRIGAANVLTYCEVQNLDATSYRNGLMSRRREAGSLRYSYGPQKIDPAVVLEIDHGRVVRTSEGGQHVTL